MLAEWCSMMASAREYAALDLNQERRMHRDLCELVEMHSKGLTNSVPNKDSVG